MIAAAVACVLTSPAIAQSSTQPGQSQVRTYTAPGSREPGWNFALQTNFGPKGEPGYPFVSGVEAGSPAERAGLLVGDTLIAVDGRDPRLPQPLFPVTVAGTRYVLRIRRGEEERELVYVHPGRNPQPARARGATE